MGKFIFISIVIFIMWAANKLSKPLAQHMEQHRINMLMETERLREENNNRFMEEYYRNKKQ